MELDNEDIKQAGFALRTPLVKLPMVPPPEVLQLLHHAGQSLARVPGIHSRGVALRQAHGTEAIPARYEAECAAGTWHLIRGAVTQLLDKEEAMDAGLEEEADMIDLTDLGSYTFDGTEVKEIIFHKEGTVEVKVKSSSMTYPSKQVLLDSGHLKPAPARYQPVPGLDVWLEDDRWKEGEIREGDKFWVIDCLNQDLVTFFIFHDKPVRSNCLSRGFAHKTKEGAIARAKVCGLLP